MKLDKPQPQTQDPEGLLIQNGMDVHPETNRGANENLKDEGQNNLS